MAMTRALKSATKVDNIKTETMNLPMIPTNKKEIALGGISEEAEEKKLKAV